MRTNARTTIPESVFFLSAIIAQPSTFRRNPPRAESAHHSSRKAENFASTAARRGTTTNQRPGGRRRRCRRKISRKRRRTRDRSTAEPVRREVITPRRAGQRSGVARAPRTMRRPCHDAPFSRTAANSARRLRRAALGNVSAPMRQRKVGPSPIKRRYGARSGPRRPWAAGACGRVGDDGPKWRVRLWSSCGRGNRAGVCACVSRLGKFFSWLEIK